MNISIISLGRLGQCLYNEFSKHGHNVIGTYKNTPKNILGEIQYDFQYDEIPEKVQNSDVVVFNLTPSSISNIKNFEKFLNHIVTKKIIFISSTSVYGNQGDVDEDTLPKPIKGNGVLLYECEKLLTEMDVNSTIIRPSGIYSKSSHPGISLSNKEFYLNPSAKINLIGLVDLVEVVMVCLEEDYKLLNISNASKQLKEDYYTDYCIRHSLTAPKFIHNSDLAVKNIRTKYKRFEIVRPLP